MLRKFTKDTGRYKKGELRDYPAGTWDRIAENVGKHLWQFSEAVENPTLQSPLKGTMHRPARLGQAPA